MRRSFLYHMWAGRHLELPTCRTVESLIRSLAWVRRRQYDWLLFVACGDGRGDIGTAWFCFRPLVPLAFVHIALERTTAPLARTCAKCGWPLSATAKASGEPAPAAPAQGSPSILVVDDDPEIGPLAADILESQGYAVVQTTDPLEAIRLARQRSEGFDLRTLSRLSIVAIGDLGAGFSGTQESRTGVISTPVRLRLKYSSPLRLAERQLALLDLRRFPGPVLRFLDRSDGESPLGPPPPPRSAESHQCRTYHQEGRGLRYHSWG